MEHKQGTKITYKVGDLEGHGIIVGIAFNGMTYEPSFLDRTEYGCVVSPTRKTSMSPLGTPLDVTTFPTIGD